MIAEKGYYYGDGSQPGGGRIYGRKAAMDMFHLKKEDLWSDTDDILTVGDFYEKSAGA